MHGWEQVTRGAPPYREPPDCCEAADGLRAKSSRSSLPNRLRAQ